MNYDSGLVQHGDGHSPKIRPAAVAGMFYPGGAGVLAHDVETMLAAARCAGSGAPPKAIIAPHAGYVYSGSVAASIYALLEPLRGRARRVVLLGPTHRVAVDGLALPVSSAFATLLGVVPVDREAVAEITGTPGLPQVVVSDEAHAPEHSLEVQLPFLQTVLGEFSLVPLAVGRASTAEVAQVIERLWGGSETLIVVSSDLSHYLPYETARQTDSATAQRILALDPHIDHRQACGATPVNGLLLAARRHGLHAHLVDLRNSGDTAGDKARVVGYGAFAFYGEIRNDR
ncbi:MAG: AmmeMemoRadiSam system protein B [Betaproteobacteria bacterium]|nr:AmmeMemoRadiSam system protein B [Betaproteobacteria bacterium]